MQSLRHSIRDRLRAVECPSDIIDQLGGSATERVGKGYCKGYQLKLCYRWLRMLSLGFVSIMLLYKICLH